VFAEGFIVTLPATFVTKDFLVYIFDGPTLFKPVVGGLFAVNFF
jgi:hypothetical protein